MTSRHAAPVKHCKPVLLRTIFRQSLLFHIQRLLFPESNSGLRLRLAGDTATMSAPGGRRSESELLKHRELKEAASPQRTATMSAEPGKIGSRRIPKKNTMRCMVFFRMSKKWLNATFLSFLIRCLRTWRGQHLMQGKPCCASAFADLATCAANPN